ncbi:hypothetical protein [Pseudoflavonifractor phocaeensis]|uniref:hypothetical protein n=1 Tax=Pseudoflavonifractor phocaeensis TaxID=1870988 RepID=UPI002109FC88|nr:hypothetical protein [Pseudoflavonifractor phocaeensis]MCQ4862712.1 hypothetical protein [Pseudoflavonifractor phocaeensis]
MRDILPYLLRAKESRVYSSLNEFLDEFSHQIPECDKKYVSNNVFDGERWIFVSNVAMFSVQIGIAFVKREHLNRYLKCFDNTILVPYDDFDLKEWYLNIESLKLEVPEIEWAASEGAVDPMHFSLQDLFYATM